MKFGVMHKAALLPLCLSQTQGIKNCGCKVEFLYYLNIDVPKGMKFTFQLKQKVYSCSTWTAWTLKQNASRNQKKLTMWHLS